MKGLLILSLLAVLAIPAGAQDYVKERLDKSPRHLEWASVKSGDRTVRCFVAYPQTKEKAAAVLVIHENRGLTDWVRGVTDQLAEAGYIAVAPDLLSGAAPKGGGTSDFDSEDAARDAIYKLPDAQVTADLNAAADFALKIPSCNGKLAVAGFCWGGGQSFRFATNRKDLKAAFVFYGMFPYTKEDLARIACPVYGFYGGSDERIGATIPDTTTAMKSAGKTYEPVTYDGAGHGFMRAGEDPKAEGPDRKAWTTAWARWKKLLSGI